jgi:hypothetical protein
MYLNVRVLSKKQEGNKFVIHHCLAVTSASENYALGAERCRSLWQPEKRKFIIMITGTSNAVEEASLNK